MGRVYVYADQGLAAQAGWYRLCCIPQFTSAGRLGKVWRVIRVGAGAQLHGGAQDLGLRQMARACGCALVGAQGLDSDLQEQHSCERLAVCSRQPAQQLPGPATHLQMCGTSTCSRHAVYVPHPACVLGTCFHTLSTCAGSKSQPCLHSCQASAREWWKCCCRQSLPANLDFLIAGVPEV